MKQNKLLNINDEAAVKRILFEFTNESKEGLTIPRFHLVFIEFKKTIEKSLNPRSQGWLIIHTWCCTFLRFLWIVFLITILNTLSVYKDCYTSAQYWTFARVKNIYIASYMGDWLKINKCWVLFFAIISNLLNVSILQLITTTIK